MVLWTDFLALALVTLVVVLFPQVYRVQGEPRALRLVIRALPVLLGFLWVSLALLWAAQG